MNSTRSFWLNLGLAVEKSFSEETGAAGSEPFFFCSLESRKRALSVAALITVLAFFSDTSG